MVFPGSFLVTVNLGPACVSGSSAALRAAFLAIAAPGEAGPLRTQKAHRMTAPSSPAGEIVTAPAVGGTRFAPFREDVSTEPGVMVWQMPDL